jgi:hypothetical protein
MMNLILSNALTVEVPRGISWTFATPGVARFYVWGPGVRPSFKSWRLSISADVQ